MANQKQLEILKSGVENWNRWREENPEEKIDLSEVNIIKADLIGADLREVFLSGAILAGAKLNRAKLNRAFLIGADLSNVDLSNAVLTGANLSGANLVVANLNVADLSGADLSNADLKMAIIINSKLKKTVLSNANFGYTTFGNVNLSEVNGLESSIHFQGSYIDYYTLQQSGNLPINFLRGCGLSDTFIKYLPSLTEQPIQYYYCFISYSTKDQEFAERLFSDLQNRGVRVWYAPDNLKPGKKVIDQIDTGIKVTDKLLLILSEDSINSEWVKTEIIKAYKKTKEIGKQVLFPISIIDFEELKKWEFYYDGEDMAQEIRDYYLLDFENWKDHDEYKKNFDKLVESLKIKRD